MVKIVKNLRYLLNLCAPTIIVIFVLSIFSGDHVDKRTSSWANPSMSSKLVSDRDNNNPLVVLRSPPDADFYVDNVEHASTSDKYRIVRIESDNTSSKPVNFNTISPSIFLKNLPDDFNFDEEDKEASKCARYPHFSNIKVNNDHYQVLETERDIFYLYGAYLDNRENNKRGSSVRMVGMNKKRKQGDSNHCRIWFNRSESVITKVSDFLPLGWLPGRNGLLEPFLLSCHLPVSHQDRIPTSVSLVEKECDDASNLLKINYNLPQAERRGNIGVCIKAMSVVKDQSVHLMEWIETMKALGVEKIFIYEFNVHSNISKVLDYYTKEDFVSRIPVSLPGFQPNFPGYQHKYLVSTHHFRAGDNYAHYEMVTQQDCLYQNMYRFDKLIIMDVDEVIVPVEHSNLPEMMKNITEKENRNTEAKKSVGGWSFPSYYFPRANMTMMSRIQRVKDTKGRIKSINNCDEVKAAGQHLPVTCLSGICRISTIAGKIGKTLHFRDSCPHFLECSKIGDEGFMVEDKVLWKVKDAVITSINKLKNRYS